MYYPPADFMRFWNVVNQILRSRNLSDMRYGEARDYFAELSHNNL